MIWEMLLLTYFHEISLPVREWRGGKREQTAESATSQALWFLSLSSHNFKMGFITISQIMTVGFVKQLSDQNAYVT